MGHNCARGILVHLDHVVLLRREHVPGNPKAFYTFPGGHLESGESLQATLVREFRAETGLEVGVGSLITTLNYTPRSGDVVRNRFYLVYLISYSRTLPVLILTGEELHRPVKKHGTYTPVWVPQHGWEELDVRPAELHQQLVRQIRSIGR